MLVRITSKRQVTFPARVLDALGAQPGDQLEIIESPDGFILRPRKINLTRLAPLRDKIPDEHEPFDLETFRTQRGQESHAEYPLSTTTTSLRI